MRCIVHDQAHVHPAKYLLAEPGLHKLPAPLALSHLTQRSIFVKPANICR
jgi:hypothetical protein